MDKPLPTDLCAVLTACAVLAKMAAWCDSDGPMPYDSDMNFDEDDDQSAYTGMSREDISARVKETFGSDFCSSRADELDVICQMMFGQQDFQTQEAFMQMLCGSKEILNYEKFLPRQIARLVWPCGRCGRCGGSGHTADHCPANDSAAAALLLLEQAEGPAGSASTKATADKKAKKRAKQAAKRAAAEKANTAAIGSSGMACDELGEVKAKSVAAPNAASVVDSADGGTADASKDTERPEQKTTAATVPVLAAASPVNSANSGAAHVAKDIQQSEQREEAKQGRSPGAVSEKTGDVDSEQVRCCSDVH